MNRNYSNYKYLKSLQYFAHGCSMLARLSFRSWKWRMCVPGEYRSRFYMILCQEPWHSEGLLRGVWKALLEFENSFYGLNTISLIQKPRNWAFLWSHKASTGCRSQFSYWTVVGSVVGAGWIVWNSQKNYFWGLLEWVRMLIAIL
jgi:hypothetical protein